MQKINIVPYPYVTVLSFISASIDSCTNFEKNYKPFKLKLFYVKFPKRCQCIGYEK